MFRFIDVPGANILFRDKSSLWISEFNRRKVARGDDLTGCPLDGHTFRLISTGRSGLRRASEQEIVASFAAIFGEFGQGHMEKRVI